MGEIHKWPQGKVEMQPILRWKNKVFRLSCEVNKKGQAKTSAPPRYLVVAPLHSGAYTVILYCYIIYYMGSYVPNRDIQGCA